MRSLEEYEISEAVEIIAEASVNDPYWVYLIPDATQRFQFMRKFLSINLFVEWTRGYLVGIGDSLEGIAVWKPPDSHASSSRRYRSLLKYYRLLSWTALVSIRKMLRVFRRYGVLRGKYAEKPYYHLILVGVRPSRQGQGYASALIRPMLLLADEEGAGAYVETTNHDNISFYEHFGFELKGEFSVPDSSLKGWGFYRPPK
jgi:ribosomal protein S18 acetylase RimI-like enzyme